MLLHFFPFYALLFEAAVLTPATSKLIKQEKERELARIDFIRIQKLRSIYKLTIYTLHVWPYKWFRSKLALHYTRGWRGRRVRFNVWITPLGEQKRALWWVVDMRLVALLVSQKRKASGFIVFPRSLKTEGRNGSRHSRETGGLHQNIWKYAVAISSQVSQSYSDCSLCLVTIYHNR